MEIHQGSGPKICTLCKRTRDEALTQQVSKGKTCGYEECTFKNEIELALNGDVAYCTHCGKKFYSASDNYCIYCGTKRV